MWRIFLIAAGFSLFACGEEWTHDYTVTGKPSLRIQTDDAGVRVSAGTSGRIHARVVTKGFRIGQDEVRVTDHQSGDRVDLQVRVPERWGFGNRSVQIEVVVPRETDVDVHTGDGGVTLTGVKGDTRLTTGDGGIRADGMDGSLDAKTGDGGIHVSGRFDLLRLNTGDGGVEAAVERGSRLASAWQIKTGDGGVRVRVPEDLSAELDVRTGDGSLTLDLPLLVSGSQEKHWIRGKLNAGGPTFTIHTNDGSVHVGRL